MKDNLAVHFYGDRDDLLQFLSAAEASGLYRFTQTYWDEGQRVPSYEGLLSVPNVGVVATAHTCPGVGYLVTNRLDEPRPEAIKLNGGGVRYKVSHATNPDSVRLSLGGDCGEQTLICSLVDTRGYSEGARQLFRVFKQIVVKQSKPVGRYRVMAGAYEKLLRGWRLTTGKLYSPQLDLSIPSRPIVQ